MVNILLKEGIDETDKAILQILQSEARISNVSLAARINLSPPATHARIKRLEVQGYIRKYAALLDREKVGNEMLCFISVSIQIHQSKEIKKFRENITLVPEVIECYNVTGEYDYLLKVVIKNHKHLEKLIGQITVIPGVSQLYTRLVMAEVKETTAIPLE